MMNEQQGDSDIRGQVLHIFPSFASAIQADEERQLKTGGGDGTSGYMEARVAKLESDMDHVKKTLDRIEKSQDDSRKTLGELKVDFGRFDERSKHFPTKGFIFSVCIGLLGAVGAIVALVVRFIPHAS